jgi:hypothetical protein
MQPVLVGTFSSEEKKKRSQSKPRKSQFVPARGTTEMQQLGYDVRMLVVQENPLIRKSSYLSNRHICPLTLNISNPLKNKKEDNKKVKQSLKKKIQKNIFGVKQVAQNALVLSLFRLPKRH